MLEKVKQVALELLGSWAPGTWALGYLGRLKMSGVVLLSSRRKLESHLGQTLARILDLEMSREN